MIKVTLYIVNHNYESYLKQCIDSVIDQTFKDIEIIILDCGSNDASRAILKEYKSIKNIKIIYEKNQPLSVTNNKAIKMARGEYIMRLDSDDYLQEHALGILVGILDRNSNLGLVFSDYFEVDSEGQILSLVRRHNFKEVTLKDQPAHGACTLIRKSIIEKIGGYDEQFTCQDGWDLWLKVTKVSEVFNTNLPLFFYRRHENNLTRNEDMLLNTRSKILMKNYTKNSKKNKKALGIISIRGDDEFETSKLIERVKERSLLDNCIEMCQAAKLINQIVISTTSKKILKSVSSKFKKNIYLILRNKEQSYTHSFYDETIFDIMGHLPSICNENFAGMILNIEHPFINESDINASISALEVFERE